MLDVVVPGALLVAAATAAAAATFIPSMLCSRKLPNPDWAAAAAAAAAAAEEFSLLEGREEEAAVVGVTVIVKGLFVEGNETDVEAADVGVTVTFGPKPTATDFAASVDVFCSLAADKPRTISSNFLRFFSFP